MKLKATVLASGGAFLQKYSGWVLTIIWLSVQAVLFMSYGVKVVPDSTYRYLPKAIEFANTGLLPWGHDNRYLLYILFLAFFLKFNLGLSAAIFAQVIISGVAAICLYKVSRQLTQNVIAAFACTLLFIVWKDVQYFNYYILTESIFTSFTLITFYLLLRARTSLLFGTLALSIALMISLLRPNGFIILLAVVASIFYQYKDRFSKPALSITMGMILLLLVLVLDRYLLSTFTIVETYARGEVIYASDIFSVKTAEPLVLPENDSPILRIVNFIRYNPLYFFKLLCLKLLVFISYVKPYYSIVHNLVIIAIIYPLYFFTFILMKEEHNYTSLKVFLLTVLLLQTVIVAATVEDWDCRFIIPILPLIFIAGTAGLSKFLIRKSA